MIVLSENIEKNFFNENDGVCEIFFKWDTLFNFDAIFKDKGVDTLKLCLAFNEMARYLIENDFEGRYRLNVLIFPIIFILMRKYNITVFDNEDLVSTFIEKSDKLFSFFDNPAKFDYFHNIDKEKEVCDLFVKIYVCKLIENDEYRLEKNEN